MLVPSGPSGAFQPAAFLWNGSFALVLPQSFVEICQVWISRSHGCQQLDLEEVAEANSLPAMNHWIPLEATGTYRRLKQKESTYYISPCKKKTGFFLGRMQEGCLPPWQWCTGLVWNPFAPLAPLTPSDAFDSRTLPFHQYLGAPSSH